MTTKAPDGKYCFSVAAADAQTIFSGGKFDLSGTGYFQPASAQNVVTIFTNGCIVTNANYFYATRYNGGSRTEIANGAKIFANKTYVMYEAGAVDNVLDIHDGGHLYADGLIYTDNAGSGEYGGAKLVVRGSGSVFRQVTDSTPAYLGYQRHSNLFRISDGAVASSANGGVCVGWNANATNNCLLVENGATASFPKIWCRSANNTILVSNATLTCSEDFNLAYDQISATNNLFRAYGSDTVLNLHGDLFGSRTNRSNTVSFEGGVNWSGGNRSRMMARTHDSTFRIIGSGTVVGDTNSWFFMGDKDVVATVSSVSNRLVIADGATLKASWLAIMGKGNELCVSNGTIHLGDGNGLRVGYRPSGSDSTNCLLVLRGTTPKIKNDGVGYNNVFTHGSTLRFEIPREGYAQGYIPFETAGQFVFGNGNPRLEVACDEFVAHTGGKLHLVHAESIDAATAERLKACSLPERCSIVVEGGDVYLKSPRRDGFIISFH